MSREELWKLDCSLDSNDEVHKILIAKRGYYIYYNEPNKNTRLINIHSHICGRCNWGSGQIKAAESGRNGVWIGPFSCLTFVENFIQVNLNEFVNQVERCSCISFYLSRVKKQ